MSADAFHAFWGRTGSAQLALRLAYQHATGGDGDQWLFLGHRAPYKRGKARRGIAAATIGDHNADGFLAVDWRERMLETHDG